MLFQKVHQKYTRLIIRLLSCNFIIDQSQNTLQFGILGQVRVVLDCIDSWSLLSF